MEGGLRDLPMALEARPLRLTYWSRVGTGNGPLHTHIQRKGQAWVWGVARTRPGTLVHVCDLLEQVE